MAKDFNHIMLDIETMGVKPGCAIVGIAAVEFDPKTAQMGKVFNTSIDLTNCCEIGFSVDAETVKWWLVQPTSARRFVAGGTRDLMSALIELQHFGNINNSFVWAKSPQFDLAILEFAYNKLQLKVPWKGKKAIDVRSIFWNNNYESNKVPAHTPLEDCLIQIYEVKQALSNKQF